jgi:hypothetical protein
MQLFRLVPIILKWLPHVVSAVTLIELFASDRSGAEKKAAALSWLERTSEKMDLPWGAHVKSTVAGLIDAAVGVANLVGYFAKGQKAKPANPDVELSRFLQEKK